MFTGSRFETTVRSGAVLRHGELGASYASSLAFRNQSPSLSTFRCLFDPRETIVTKASTIFDADIDATNRFLYAFFVLRRENPRRVCAFGLAQRAK